MKKKILAKFDKSAPRNIELPLIDHTAQVDETLERGAAEDSKQMEKKKDNEE